MDASKITQKVSRLLVDVVEHHVVQHSQVLLKSVAENYNLDYEELLHKYGTMEISLDLGKARKKNELKTDADGKQTEPKKRGRKKKFREELIETEEYEFNGVVYLVDNNNNVYSNNPEQPTLLGTKLIDGRVKFLTQ
jgi:hypothetical protein